MAKTEVMGLGDLGQTYRELKTEMDTRTARGMVVSAGGVLKRKAKEIAIGNGSRRTGVMVKNIAIKREKQAPPGTAQYHLGVRNGGDLSSKSKKAGKRLVVRNNGRIGVQYVDDPYYWKWVEKGHKIVGREPVADGVTTYETTLRNGKKVIRKKAFSGAGLRARRRASTGSVEAKPFIAPALEQGRGEAIEAMNKRLQRDLEKAQRK